MGLGRKKSLQGAGNAVCGHKEANLGLKTAISGQKWTFREKEKTNFGGKSDGFGVEINFGGQKGVFEAQKTTLRCEKSQIPRPKTTFFWGKNPPFVRLKRKLKLKKVNFSRSGDFEVKKADLGAQSCGSSPEPPFWGWKPPFWSWELPSECKKSPDFNPKSFL